MNRTITAFVIAMAFTLCANAQDRLQIVFMNKEARTFVRTGNDWILARMDTPINASTVFKNYSDPPSRVVIRDWGRSMQYEIRLDQQECAMSEVLSSIGNERNGLPLRFVARKIEESHSIHYSRSAAAIVQRGTNSETQHSYARDVLAGLISGDGLFHIDSLAYLPVSYPAGLVVQDDGSLVMTNYSDKELYFTPLLTDVANDGKRSVKPLCPDDFFVILPYSEQQVSPQNKDYAGKTIILFATEQFVDPYILGVRLGKAENKKIERKTPRGSGVVVLNQ